MSPSQRGNTFVLTENSDVIVLVLFGTVGYRH